MDIINTILNIIIPPISTLALISFLPCYLLLKFTAYIIRSIFSENVAGKVVLITGASSGMGEHLAYEYARRGAYLALAARRINSLREVADRALKLGSPGVIAVQTDVSKVKDCERLLNETINHFGLLDHLVLRAGETPVCLFEEVENVKKLAPVMASKAAIVSFYETLRVELGSDVGITMVIPGLIESEMTKGKFLNTEGRLEVNQALRDAELSIIPVETIQTYVNAVINSARRGDHHFTEPYWYRSTFYWRMFWPESLKWLNRWFLVPIPGVPPEELPSKKILDITGLKKIVYPPSLLSPEIKRD